MAFTTTPTTDLEPEVVESPGERFVYLVKSRTRNRRYRVELTANGGGCACACKDFQIRRQENIDRGLPKCVPVHPDDKPAVRALATWCPHCLPALRHFWLQIAPRLETAQ